MKRMLITAGPTHEAIDAVRYIGNRSSGRMGIALAEAARDAGWEVTLLLGPVYASPTTGIRVERFTSTDELARLLDKHFDQCDVLVMAAAVADYRPSRADTGKLPRSGKLTLELEATPDLVAACAARKTQQRIVGFALESGAMVEQRAKEKLRAKHLDAIVANPLETMESPTIAARVFTLDGGVHAPAGGSEMDKDRFGRWLVDWIGQRWGANMVANNAPKPKPKKGKKM